MSASPARIISALLIVIFITLVSVSSSAAQNAAVVQLSIPDASQFPHLTAYLDVHNEQGSFVQRLTAGEVTILEDGIDVPVTDMQELTPGVQFVIGISPGASFSIRDGMGISRYEYFLQGLSSFNWTPQPAGIDDFSLLTLDGPQITHLSELPSILSALESYTPTIQTSEPGLEILSSALQVASDPSPHPGMERVLLYITSPQESDISLGLQSIITSANQQNVRIFVWVLAAPEAFQAPQIAQLRKLAEQTGGSFWGFSHDEAVPDLQSMLEPLRHVYQLRYDSQIRAPGTHQVSAAVIVGSETITSQAQAFNIDLQPPTVKLVGPPLEITRSYSNQPTPVAGGVLGDLLPIEQLLRLSIAFPDGYEHSIADTRLYVDGSLVAENSKPPFDQLAWDIRPYTQDGVHTLVVEATDNLGLVGRSSDVAVRITVPSTTQEMMVTVSKNVPLLIGGVVVIAGSIIVLALIVGGNIRPRPHPGQPKPLKNKDFLDRLPRLRAMLRRLKTSTPVTSSAIGVPAEQANGTTPRWLRYLPWLKRKELTSPAKAYLTPLVGFDEPTLPSPLQITTDDVSLGTDARQVSLVITDPSINGVHAYIHHDGKIFVITDAGTVAGTWVNYEQVPLPGRQLAHMDIIHLGRIGFRFQSSEPGQLRKIMVTPVDQSY